MAPIINYYTVLGVARTATDEEIKTAFRKLALVWHPDKNPSHDSEVEFEVMIDAYGILMNAEKRLNYDDELEQQDGQFPAERTEQRITRRTVRRVQQISYIRNQSKEERNWSREQAKKARFMARRQGAKDKHYFSGRSGISFMHQDDTGYLPDDNFPYCRHEDSDEFSDDDDETSDEIIVAPRQLAKWERNLLDVPPQPNADRIEQYLIYMDSRKTENIVLYEPKSGRREAKLWTPQQGEAGYKQANRAKGKCRQNDESNNVRFMANPCYYQPKKPEQPREEPEVTVSADQYLRMLDLVEKIPLEERMRFKEQCLAALRDDREEDFEYYVEEMEFMY